MDQRGCVPAGNRCPRTAVAVPEARAIAGWSVVGTTTGKGPVLTVKAASYPVTLNEE
ncbi:hypothetical protein [Streptomyces sp. NPDC059863]|uniref:hypothetical protein n=1 Tax=unclassified Streptomyces TaxID=2593676 RepID=UPI00364CFE2D